MRENDILKGEQGALKRALYKSMGFTGDSWANQSLLLQTATPMRRRGILY